MSRNTKKMVASTADILRLMVPGLRPDDPGITAIREFLADRYDGPPRRGCADSESSFVDFDRAAVDAITTVFLEFPDHVDENGFDEWRAILGDIIVLPLRLRGCIVNVIDIHGEYYAPRWFERHHYVDIIAASQGKLRRP